MQWIKKYRIVQNNKFSLAIGHEVMLPNEMPKYENNKQQNVKIIKNGTVTKVELEVKRMVKR